MDNQAFIHCKKNVIISGKDWKHSIPADYMGAVPEYVTNHWFYKALCKDGVITSIVTVGKSDVIADNSAELKAAAQKKKAEEIRAAKKRAKAEAEAEAEKRGLDEITKKNLIKESQEAAVEKVEANYKE